MNTAEDFWTAMTRASGKPVYYDDAYREKMQLSPEQFIRLQQIDMQRKVCDGGKCTFIIGAVLAAVGLAQLDAGDLGDRVPLVGRFQGAGKQ